jgi:hypothetical protein
MYAMHSIDCLSSCRRQVALAGLSVLVLAGLHAPQAQAEVLASSTNAAPQLFGTRQALVDLATAAGAQNALRFTTKSDGLVEITLSAECSVDGTASQYGSIDLRVNADGPGPIVPIAPTVGTDDAFCSGNAVPGNLDGFVMASVTTVINVPAGDHELQVLARAVNGASQLRLDDLSITVDN